MKNNSLAKRTAIIAAACILCCADVFTVSFPSYATKTEIDNAEKKKKNLEQEIKKTQESISQLEGLKKDVSAYINKLDKELTDTEAEIAEIESRIQAKEGEITAAEAELKEAEDNMADRYADMKLRIRYMYEQSKTGILDTILAAESLTDLLSRSEYFNDITGYDRDRLDEIQQLTEEIEVKKAQLAAEHAELEDLLSDAQVRRERTEALMKDKKNELGSYTSQIGKAQEQLAQYNAEIKKQEDTIKSIEAAIKKREEEARKAAEAAGKAYKTVNLGDISFRWPCPSSGRVTSYFGDRESPVAGASTNHKGIDIGASSGNDIIAAAGGEVIIATYSASAGNYIMISHGGDVSTVYMHCSKLLVSEGQTVKKGDVIGKVGSTGYSTGPHLHFGIRAGGKYINPLAYVSP